MSKKTIVDMGKNFVDKFKVLDLFKEHTFPQSDPVIENMLDRYPEHPEHPEVQEVTSTYQPAPIVPYDPTDIIFLPEIKYLTGEEQIRLRHNCETMYQEKELIRRQEYNKAKIEASRLLIKGKPATPADVNNLTATEINQLQKQIYNIVSSNIKPMAIKPGQVIQTDWRTSGVFSSMSQTQTNRDNDPTLGVAIIATPEDFDKIKPIVCRWCHQTIEAVHIKAAWWRKATKMLRT